MRADEPVAAALELLAHRAVTVLPVLEGDRYLGAVTAESLAGVDEQTCVAALAKPLLPVVPAGTPLTEALAAARQGDISRVVVVDGAAAYAGILCIRSDHARLCVHFESQDDSQFRPLQEVQTP
ncbi:MAG: CBS domain-containing protein [Gaiellales bacterium]